MPEYLAPGVFVEETSFRQKTIEGVGTSTAGFVGPARFGPATGLPELLTGFGDFERIFGGIDQLMIGTDQLPNYLAYGVRSFFENGGRRCYVSRVVGDGTAASTATITEGGSTLTLTARHPGRAGDFQVTLTLRLGPNIFDGTGDISILRGANEYDVVWIDDDGSGSDRFVYLHDAFDATNGVWSYEYRDENEAPLATSLVAAAAATDVRRLTVR